jgi:hypothetical protein
VNFFSLGNSPLANVYLSKDDLRRNELYYPLDLCVCDERYSVQLEEVKAPENNFSAGYAHFFLSIRIGGWNIAGVTVNR